MKTPIEEVELEKDLCRITFDHYEKRKWANYCQKNLYLKAQTEVFASKINQNTQPIKLERTERRNVV